jgi:predicted aspartyl protease
MGLTYVAVALKNLGALTGAYEADFLVDTRATDCMAPAAKLRQIGVQPVGTKVYELANGARHEYRFRLVEIRFMGEITAGRVIFGADDVEPLLGVTALESVGIAVDPATQTLRRLPATPLKMMAPSQGLKIAGWPPHPALPRLRGRHPLPQGGESCCPNFCGAFTRSPKRCLIGPRAAETCNAAYCLPLTAYCFLGAHTKSFHSFLGTLQLLQSN